MLLSLPLESSGSAVLPASAAEEAGESEDLAGVDS
jgi:hypothetical protein